MGKRPHYVSYIKPHVLNTLQIGLGDADTRSERTFIRAHQVQELLLSQVTDEIDAALDYMCQDDVPPDLFCAVERHFERALRAANNMVDELKMLEAISPLEFNKFRPKFGNASGRQSPAFRLFEALLGAKQEIEKEIALLEDHPFPTGTQEADYIHCVLERIHVAMAGRNLASALFKILGRLPFPDPETGHLAYPAHEKYEQFRQQFAQAYLTKLATEIDPNVAEYATEFFLGDDPSGVKRVRLGALLILTGVKLPLLAGPRRWLTATLALESAWFRWQAAHADVVRNSIGFAPGSGGTTGMSFLLGNLDRQIFAEIHQVKVFVARPELTPEMLRGYGYEAENKVLQLSRRRGKRR